MVDIASGSIPGCGPPGRTPSSKRVKAEKNKIHKLGAAMFLSACKGSDPEVAWGSGGLSGLFCFFFLWALMAYGRSCPVISSYKCKKKTVQV